MTIITAIYDHLKGKNLSFDLKKCKIVASKRLCPIVTDEEWETVISPDLVEQLAKQIQEEIDKDIVLDRYKIFTGKKKI